jgi:hypothetical protein
MMKLPPWTYGFLTDDANCPRKAWHKYVAKDLPREKKTDAQDWGIKVHKSFELRIKEGTPLPADMQRWERFVLAIDQAKADGYSVLAEENLAIDSTGQPARNYFGDNVWGRGRLDAVLMGNATAIIFDWKTGKPNEDPLELETQALMLKCMYPNLRAVTGQFVWLKEDRMGRPHDLSNFARTMNDVRTRMRDVEARPLETEWPAKPNPLCGWCSVFSCAHNSNRNRP